MFPSQNEYKFDNTSASANAEPTNQTADLLFRIPLWMDISMHLLPAVALIIGRSYVRSSAARHASLVYSPIQSFVLRNSVRAYPPPCLTTSCSGVPDTPFCSIHPYPLIPWFRIRAALINIASSEHAPPHAPFYPLTPRLLLDRRKVPTARIDPRRIRPGSGIRDSLRALDRTCRQYQRPLPVPFLDGHEPRAEGGVLHRRCDWCARDIPILEQLASVVTDTTRCRPALCTFARVSGGEPHDRNPCLALILLSS